MAYELQHWMRTFMLADERMWVPLPAHIRSFRKLYQDLSVLDEEAEGVALGEFTRSSWRDYRTSYSPLHPPHLLRALGRSTYALWRAVGVLGTHKEDMHRMRVRKEEAASRKAKVARIAKRDAQRRKRERREARDGAQDLGFAWAQSPGEVNTAQPEQMHYDESRSLVRVPLSDEERKKRTRKLEKKLRQVEALEAKIAAGHALEPAQLAKAQTGASLRANLAALGA